LNTSNIPIQISPVGAFLVKKDYWWINNFPDNDKVTWEPETFEILGKYVTKVTLVIDLGSWFGPTAFFSSQLGKQVIAMEPDPVAFCTIELLNPD
jgi:predicted RNA methylase